MAFHERKHQRTLWYCITLYYDDITVHDNTGEYSTLHGNGAERRLVVLRVSARTSPCNCASSSAGPFFHFPKTTTNSTMKQFAHGSQFLWIVAAHVCSAPHPLPYPLHVHAHEHEHLHPTPPHPIINVTSSTWHVHERKKKNNKTPRRLVVPLATTLHCIALHYITLHCIALHYIALHCIALHYVTLHYIALHYITLHCIALHYIALHCIALHYITLHTCMHTYTYEYVYTCIVYMYIVLYTCKCYILYMYI